MTPTQVKTLVISLVVLLPYVPLNSDAATKAFAWGPSPASQAASVPKSPRDHAADFVPGAEIAAAVNVPDKNLKLEGSLFTPDKTVGRAVRAVLVVIHWGYTEELLTGLNPYSAMHRLTRDLDGALLHVRISTIHAPRPGPTPPELVVQRNAATGSGDGLLRLLEVLAADSGRLELKSAPLLFWGWSAAGGFGPSFAKLHPDRTLGFVQYQSHRRGLPSDWSVLANIPALIVVGGEQQKDQNDDSTMFWNEGRSRGAPWAFVQQHGVGHGLKMDDLSALDQVLVPWVQGVVRGRLAESSGPRLRPIAVESGWVAVQASRVIAPVASYSGPREGTSWFPSEETARAWQALAGK